MRNGIDRMPPSQLKALDLFCGGGGASEGLMRAGFEVTGVDRDLRCRRYYPGEFIGGDVFEVAETLDLGEFDFIWASPPCQAFSTASGNHDFMVRFLGTEDLIEDTRELLAPYRYTCIENVPQAPIRKDLVLTGPLFGLNNIVRKRVFEMGWEIDSDYQPYIWHSTPDGFDVEVILKGLRPPSFTRRRRRAQGKQENYSRNEAMEYMGMSTYMHQDMIGEAIPPAYACYIAELALIYMENENAI